MRWYHCCPVEITAVPRSTLADANKQRPAVIFEKTYYNLYERLSTELSTQPQQRVAAYRIPGYTPSSPWQKISASSNGTLELAGKMFIFLTNVKSNWRRQDS